MTACGHSVHSAFPATPPGRSSAPANIGSLRGAKYDNEIVDDRQASAPRRPATPEATLGQLASGRFDESPHAGGYDDLPTAAHAFQRRQLADDDRDLVPLSPVQPLADRLGLSAVDPLLLRIGTMILVAVMLVPIALALRPAAADVIEGAAVASTAVDAADESTAPDFVAAGVAAGVFETAGADSELGQQSSATTADTATVAAGSTGTGDVAASVATQPAAVQVATSGSVTESADSVGDVAQDQPSTGGQPATVSEPAERQQPECPSTYVAGPGDSWYRIADEADVTPSALLDQNLASIDSVIFPGDDICLPEGAKMPTQPVVTSDPPATTQPSATTTPTPTTTTPPTTQPTTPPATVSTDEVQRLIREIWPDELEERALEIARRESNYKSSVYNGWCCYGVFQIYWTVHRSWLDDYGITSSNRSARRPQEHPGGVRPVPALRRLRPLGRLSRRRRRRTRTRFHF